MKRKIMRLTKRSPECDMMKEKMFYIDGEVPQDYTKESLEEVTEYKDIVSVTIIFKFWHIADNIFKNLDAVSLLHCEKVSCHRVSTSDYNAYPRSVTCGSNTSSEREFGRKLLRSLQTGNLSSNLQTFIIHHIMIAEIYNCQQPMINCLTMFQKTLNFLQQAKLFVKFDPTCCCY